MWHRVLTFCVFTQVPNDLATRSVQVSSLNLSPCTYIVHLHVTAIKCYDTLEEPLSFDLRCCFLTSSTSSISTSKPRGDMPLHVPIGVLDSVPPFLIRGRDMIFAIRRGGMCGVPTKPNQVQSLIHRLAQMDGAYRMLDFVASCNAAVLPAKLDTLFSCHFFALSRSPPPTLLIRSGLSFSACSAPAVHTTLIFDMICLRVGQSTFTRG